MNFASVVLAAGVVAGGLLVVPLPLRTPTWIGGLGVIALWIVASPELLRRRSAATDAGWLSGLGLLSSASGLGIGGALAGMAIAVTGAHGPAIAVMVLSSAGALALGLAALAAMDTVKTISAQKTHISRHTVWERKLTDAAAQAGDEGIRRLRLECADAARCARRDPDALGLAINDNIDAAVARLCTPAGSASAESCKESAAAFRALLAKREHADGVA